MVERCTLSGSHLKIKFRAILLTSILGPKKIQQCIGKTTERNDG